jgi:ABC-2 type transport system ATP-binding protein
MIRVDNVTKEFGEVVAVDHVSLGIPKGTILGMIGPNGAGKTTLVRMMVGILPPTSGMCFIGDKPSDHLTSQERARMGYMTQQKALYPDLTARENLEFFATSYGIKNPQRRLQLITHAAQLTKITDSMDRPVEVLSGGTIQRLSLACAIAHDPELIFLDEPTVGVSPDLRTEFWDYFRRLAREGKTIVMTTHYLDEASKCDAVAMIFQGRILAHGAPEEIINSLRLESTISGIVETADSARLVGALKGIAEAEISGRRFMVAANDDATLLRIFKAIVTSGITVSSIVVRQPTLEEAFAHLVRRRQQ